MPIVFVHGAAGSAAQYETQARRFDGNGYPASLRAGVRVRLVVRDQHVRAGDRAPRRHSSTRLRTEFGVDRVYLVGHSLGTFVSNTYLGDAGRAAKIAKYVGIDGSSNASCGVAEPEPRLHGDLAGDEHDGQRRRQQRPPQPADARAGGDFRGVVRRAVRVLHRGGAGDDARAARSRPARSRSRAARCEFPQNVGAAGATLEVWEVDARTGARKDCGAARDAHRRGRRQLGAGQGQRAAGSTSCS